MVSGRHVSYLFISIIHASHMLIFDPAPVLQSPIHHGNQSMFNVKNECHCYQEKTIYMNINLLFPD